MPLDIVTIVGARPQFIKAAPVCHALRDRGHSELLVHTGQHYDANMSQVFFDEMDIPAPDVNLNVGSGPHGRQTARMLEQIELILQERQPGLVVVYGDTNSTLAGALAACKLHIPLVHIESGLRSFNRIMPEEHNRVLTDHCADVLCCPTPTAVTNLRNEGIRENVHLVGDTMYDAVLSFSGLAAKGLRSHAHLDLPRKRYYLATVHRAENTDDPGKLRNLLDALSRLEGRVVLPVHPRTRARLESEPNRSLLDKTWQKIELIDPVSYLDMLHLLENARMVFTDSGGVQKEAYFLDVPCVTLREETEWIELVDAGWNRLAGTDPDRMLEAASETGWPQEKKSDLFGDGNAASRIVRVLEEI